MLDGDVKKLIIIQQTVGRGEVFDDGGLECLGATELMFPPPDLRIIDLRLSQDGPDDPMFSSSLTGSPI